MPIGQKSTMQKLIYFLFEYGEPIHQKFTLIDGGIRD